MKKRMLCFAFLCVGFLPVKAQQDQVRGAIQDEAGVFIPGASVKAIHTGNGKSFMTSSSEKGLFTFNGLPEGGPYQFIFNSIGFRPDTLSGYMISKGKQLSISAKLRGVVNDLQEVVIGYGKVSRKDVTSSITTIKAEDFNQGVYTSPAQILQGKVPGLVISANNNPNATPSVTLRGASTLRSGEAMEPYYVIDGVPGASLALVSPDDIASIDVLRDASATAIYGSKAANGVIIVTTKRGTTNQTSISYNGYMAIDKVAKRWELMNASQYKSFVLDNGFSLDPYDDKNANTNWQKEVERTGVSNSHNFSIIGNNEKTKYNASMNYFKNNGVIEGTDMGRLIGRALVETKRLNDRLDLSFNINASITKQNDVPAQGQGLSVYDAMAYYLPISPVKNEDGSWFEYPQRSQYANPVSLIEENTIFNNTKMLQGHAKGSYLILPGLKYNLDLSLQNREFKQSRYNSSKSMVAAGMNGQANRSVVEDERVVIETNFSYEKTFADRHKITALLGYSWEENNNNDGFQLATYNYYSDDLLYYNPGLANNVNVNGLGGYNLSTLRMISLYSRINYAFDGKYLLQATVRRDGSSAFGVNNRWGTFPSLSAAWRISEEPFMKSLQVFDDLKLRAGYGVSGNSLGFDVFSATQVYGATGWFTSAAGNELRTLGATRNANPDLRWERTDMLNVGLDFALFRNRLGGSVEFYEKNTTDLIYDYPVSTTKYLYSLLTTNVGEINNRGFEVSLNGTPVKGKDFSWNTGVVFSHNKNKVVKISNSDFTVNYIDLADLDGAGQSNARQQRLMEGSPIGQFYTWEWAGYNDEGVSVFYVRDKDTGVRTGETTSTPMDKDRAATGSAQPKYTLGWNNTFAYKNLSLTALFQGVFGNKIMNGTRARYSNVVGNAGNKNLLLSVLETEKVTDVNAHYLSDRYLEKGDYLRLSSLSLGYNFKKIGSGINNLNLFATVNNAFILTKYKGLDPEVYLGGLTPGLDNRQTYPRTRTFMFGVNFNL